MTGTAYTGLGLASVSPDVLARYAPPGLATGTQGANDPRVPVGEAVQIHEALTARGVESGLIIFPDEGHGMSKRANQVTTLGHVLDFFGRHLR